METHYSNLSNTRESKEQGEGVSGSIFGRAYDFIKKFAEDRGVESTLHYSDWIVECVAKFAQEEIKNQRNENIQNK